MKAKSKKKKGIEPGDFIHVPMKKSQVNRISKHFGALHGHLDQVILDAGKNFEISCTKGCSACCKQAVTLSVPEAIALIAPIIFDPNRARYYFNMTYPKVKEQAKRCMSGDVTVQSWFESELHCVFLQNDLCTLYDTRPSTCRVHSVMSPSALCSPPRNEVLSKVDIVGWVDATKDVTLRVSRECHITSQIAPLPVAVMWATIAMKGGVDYLSRELSGHRIFSDDNLAVLWWGLRFIDKSQWEKNNIIGGLDESRKQV